MRRSQAACERTFGLIEFDCANQAQMPVVASLRPIEIDLLYRRGPSSGCLSRTMDLSRFEFPPGPSYVLRQLFSFKVAAYGTFVGSVHVVGKLLGIDLPLWMIVSCSIIALPAILYTQVGFQYWRNKRKAESLGARLAPEAPSKWPGGLDLIIAGANVFRAGYIGETGGYVHIVRDSDKVILGDAVGDWLTKGGQTIDVYTLWTSRVSLLTNHHRAKHPDTDRRS